MRREILFPFKKRTISSCTTRRVPHKLRDAPAKNDNFVTRQLCCTTAYTYLTLLFKVRHALGAGSLVVLVPQSTGLALCDDRHAPGSKEGFVDRFCRNTATHLSLLFCGLGKKHFLEGI